MLVANDGWALSATRSVRHQQGCLAQTTFMLLSTRFEIFGWNLIPSRLRYVLFCPGEFRAMGSHLHPVAALFCWDCSAAEFGVYVSYCSAFSLDSSTRRAWPWSKPPRCYGPPLAPGAELRNVSKSKPPHHMPWARRTLTVVFA